MLRSHSFAGVRGLKFYQPLLTAKQNDYVALLRGGAWIEMAGGVVMLPRISKVALLRGGAWIEIQS